MPRSVISRVAEARSVHRAIVNRLRFFTLSTVYVEEQMEKLQFDGKAIEGLRELVEHHAHQQERCQQPASNAAESHGRASESSEEARRVP